MDSEIIGRDNILALLQKRYDYAQLHGCVDLISGEAGIGKTTVINRYIEEQKSRGVSAAYAQCSSLTEGDDLYKPCNDIFNILKNMKQEDPAAGGKALGFIRKVASSKFVDITGQLLGLIPGFDVASTIIGAALTAMNRDGESKEDAVEKYKNDTVSLYADMIVGMSKLQPLIVVFDDLHWADRGTTNVIKEIYQKVKDDRTGITPRLQLICAFRESEAKTDLMHNGINELLHFMDRYNVVRNGAYFYEKQTVEPLSDTEMDNLLSWLFDNNESLSSDLKKWVKERTAGNPLLLNSYVEILKQNGIVIETDDGWKDFGEVSFSEGRPVLKGRILNAERKGVFRNRSSVALEALRNLDESNTRILYTAAVIGDSFSTRMLSSVMDIPEEELFWKVKELIRLGFIRKTDDFNDGFDTVERYGIISKALKEALRNDMPARQIRLYEGRIGDYYKSLADRSEKLMDIMAGLGAAGTMPQNIIEIRQKIIENAGIRYHRLASIHYENAGRATEAIRHSIPALEAVVDRYEDLNDDDPSPKEMNTVLEAVDSDMKRINGLFRHVIEEAALSGEDNQEAIDDLRIRTRTVYARYYGIFGQYRKAIEKLGEAEKIAELTEGTKDDVDICRRTIDISYSCGDYAKGREYTETLVSYFERHADRWDVDDIEDCFDDVSKHFIDDYVLADLYAERMIKVLINHKSKYLDDVLGRYYLALLKGEEFDKAESIYQQIVSVQGISSLISIIAEDFVVMLLDYDLETYWDNAGAGDLIDGKYDLFNQYNWEWRVNACSEVISNLGEYYSKNKKSMLPYDIAALGYALLYIGVWLSINSELQSIEEGLAQEGEKPKDRGLTSDGVEVIDGMIAELKEACKEIRNGLSSSEEFHELLDFLYENERVRYGESAWYQSMLQILIYWPDEISGSRREQILHSLLDSPEAYNDLQDDALLADALDSLFPLPEGGSKLKEYYGLIIKKFIEPEKNPITKAKFVDSSLIAPSYTAAVIDIYPYVEEAVRAYLDNDMREEAEGTLELLEQDVENGSFPKDQYKKIRSMVNAGESDVTEESKGFEYDVTSEDDDFIRWRAAELLRGHSKDLAAEDGEQKECLSLMIRASSLVEGNKLAETKLDDFYDDLGEICYMSAVTGISSAVTASDIRDLWGDEIGKKDVYRYLVDKSIYYNRRALEMNREFYDQNCVLEEYDIIMQRILDWYGQGGEEKEAADSVMKHQFGGARKFLDDFSEEVTGSGRIEWALEHAQVYEEGYTCDETDTVAKALCTAASRAVGHYDSEKLRKHYAEYIDNYYDNFEEQDEYAAIMRGKPEQPEGPDSST